MNKGLIGCLGVGAIILFILLIGGCGVAGSYNRLVGLQQKVDQSWAQVQNVYQRRADLIPNLVNTVQGAANFEKSTLTEVTNARAYPELRATQNFQSLQAQLEGTENRISVERGNFNSSVQDYNTAVRTFPTNLFAGMFGFRQRPFFEAQAGAEKPPTVNFNFGSPAAPPAATAAPTP